MDKRKELNKVVKDSIAESVLLLLKEKTLPEIKVTEIITKAGVARASFYRNFKYKEDPIVYFLVEKMNEYKNTIKKEDLDLHKYETIYGTMVFVMKYKEELTSIFKSNLSQVLLEAINQYVLSVYHVDSENPNEKYIYYSYSGSIFNIIYQWIAQGAKETPKELAALICS